MYKCMTDKNISNKYFEITFSNNLSININNNTNYNANFILLL